MTTRFVVNDSAIQGRSGIFDQTKGNRMVAFFLADPANPEAAPRMAQVCADALNAAVTRRHGENHETR